MNIEQLKKDTLKEARDRIMHTPEDYDDFLLEVIDMTADKVIKAMLVEEKKIRLRNDLNNRYDMGFNYCCALQKEQATKLKQDL